jgi:hypothetical protein
MKKIILLAILIIISACSLFCQEDSDSSKIKTKVYLKNKGILIGELVSMKQDSSFVLKINTSYLTLKMNDIIKMVMYEDKDKRIVEHFRLYKKVYYNMQLSSISNGVYAGFAFNQSVLYRMNNLLLLGAGTGLENYTENVDLNMMPLYGVAKLYMSNQRATPFLMAKYGYGFILSKLDAITEGSHGGQHFNALLGLRLGGSNFVTEIFGGIKQQSLLLSERSSRGVFITDLKANRFEFGIGFIF